VALAGGPLQRRRVPVRGHVVVGHVARFRRPLLLPVRHSRFSRCFLTLTPQFTRGALGGSFGRSAPRHHPPLALRTAQTDCPHRGSSWLRRFRFHQRHIFAENAVLRHFQRLRPTNLSTPSGSTCRGWEIMYGCRLGSALRSWANIP
jgi:hypothetical protein